MLEILLCSRKSSPESSLKFLANAGTAEAGSFALRNVKGVLTLQNGQTYPFDAAGDYSLAVNIPVQAGAIRFTISRVDESIPGYISTFDNSRITEVTDWKSIDPGINLSLNNCKALVKVPTIACPTTKYSGLFRGCSAFNQDISRWDVSHVTDMVSMFYSCSAFNQPLNSWNTTNVTDMSYMFYNCSVFNRLLDSWDTTNVTNMGYMFCNCSVFDQPLNSWNTANVTNMGNMFYSCSAFNQPLNSWNTTNVTNMSSMFYNCSVFNQTIASWNVSKVTIIEYMFQNCYKFNQNLSSMIFKATVSRLRYDYSATAWNVAYRPKFTGA